MDVFGVIFSINDGESADEDCRKPLGRDTCVPPALAGVVRRAVSAAAGRDFASMVRAVYTHTHSLILSRNLSRHVTSHSFHPYDT